MPVDIYDYLMMKSKVANKINNIKEITLGLITPGKNELKVSLKTFESFNKLKNSARKEGIQLGVISSYRSFEQQKIIWNKKAQGLRPLYSKNGALLDYDQLSQEELLEAILNWSAIPGTSRHHWGTDIDIYDESKVQSKDEVELLPQESKPGGKFERLHNWLSEQIKENKSFGFFRPYSKDLGGVNPEDWHISYYPESNEILNSFTLDIFVKMLNEQEILLKNLLLERPDFYFKKFIKNISPPTWVN